MQTKSTQRWEEHDTNTRTHVMQKTQSLAYTPTHTTKAGARLLFQMSVGRKPGEHGGKRTEKQPTQKTKTLKRYNANNQNCSQEVRANTCFVKVLKDCQADNTENNSLITWFFKLWCLSNYVPQDTKTEARAPLALSPIRQLFAQRCLLYVLKHTYQQTWTQKKLGKETCQRQERKSKTAWRLSLTQKKHRQKERKERERQRGDTPWFCSCPPERQGRCKYSPHTPRWGTSMRSCTYDRPVSAVHLLCWSHRRYQYHHLQLLTENEAEKKTKMISELHSLEH